MFIDSFILFQNSFMFNFLWILVDTPKLLVSSSNITVKQSKPVSFHCAAKANPPVLRYNWTKDIPLSESGSTYNITSANVSIKQGIFFAITTSLM